MAEVIAEWGDDDRLDTLTPVYGPEVIRGSTRMKGATCTKLLLETIFQLALQAAGIDCDDLECEIIAEWIEIDDWKRMA